MAVMGVFTQLCWPGCVGKATCTAVWLVSSICFNQPTIWLGAMTFTGFENIWTTWELSQIYYTILGCQNTFVFYACLVEMFSNLRSCSHWKPKCERKYIQLTHKHDVSSITQFINLPPKYGTCGSIPLPLYFNSSGMEAYNESMYTYSHCVTECNTHYALEMCGCRDAYMPGMWLQSNINYDWSTMDAIERSHSGRVLAWLLCICK